eukprot:1571114-Lingulodinium_polyedra.AAC.1
MGMDSVGTSAGWSWVQIDKMGEPVAWAYGAVPPHLPQTSAAGEHAAFSMAVQAAKGEATILPDYLGVVMAAGSHPAPVPSPA